MENSHHGEVCTTQEAARILGLSVSSVQQLVESGAIRAWKTPGGHRRIPLAEVRAYMAASAPAVAPSPTPTPLSAGSAVREPEGMKVLIMEDNAMQQELYAHQFAQWQLPLTVLRCDSGYQALMEVAANRPDVLLADVVMEGIDGLEVIRTVFSYPRHADMDVAVVTSLDPQAIEQRGGLPPGVLYFPKPVNPDELLGFLRACQARHARRAGAAR